MNTVESVFGIRLTRRTAMKGLLAASAAGAFAAHGIGAFAQDATPGVSDYPEVVIVGTEFAFDMPASVAGGWTRITLDNQGAAMDHHAMLMRVNDGSTYEDLGAALQSGDFGAIFAVSTSVGGPMAGPGGTASVIAALASPASTWRSASSPMTRACRTWPSAWPPSSKSRKLSRPKPRSPIPGSSWWR
ncbi:MAG: hypothetical protein M3Q50_10935 [Chloroflexota bacterium]|nr:hypothetical protein [Chloroflexota bacterium]